MSNPVEPTPPPAGDDRNLAAQTSTAVQPPFEERLRLFWEKNRGLVLGICLLVLLVIVGRSGWELLQQRRAAAQAEAYAAAEGPEALRGFAEEHNGSTLAGVARLRLADEAFADGRFGEAATAYTQAVDALEDVQFQARARLGAAMATLKSGDEAGGKSRLEALANDVSAPKATRAEAAYHLASLAAGANQLADVSRLVEQINAIDSTSLWAQRAMVLPRQEAPSASADEAAQEGEGPAVSFPAKSP